MHPPMITPDQIEAYDRDGAICLRGLFDVAWLDRLAVGMEKNFASPGPDAMHYDPGGFHDDYCNWTRIAEYEDFIRRSPAAEIAGRLMRSRSARIYHDHVLVKEPGTAKVTPWHHDQPYYGLDGNQLCSIWLPLDPVPRAVCPEFVAGSHKWRSLYYPRQFLDQSNYADGHAGYDTVPDIDAQRDRLTILSWALARGDCILFHMRTLHGAPGNPGTDTRRRGFSTRWMGDDARFATRPWTTSPPFADIGLTPGDPMDHPMFPAVWTMG